ncbi:hypothetical protein RQM65_05540 [Pricia sp. S334]|uniref:Uncharacterized protein n=1 Tax=Pricia mediterranea TaxID=3076079 RepID=A0ABU3L367_9FLAO|nr:hypothetical protein [Pricia sp. S334]MDT7828127.1 hypothetical protein [Pricia sp. S334]
MAKSIEAIDAAMATSPVRMYDINKVSIVPITLQLVALAILRKGRSDFRAAEYFFWEASLFKIKWSKIIGRLNLITPST